MFCEMEGDLFILHEGNHTFTRLPRGFITDKEMKRAKYHRFYIPKEISYKDVEAFCLKTFVNDEGLYTFVMSFPRTVYLTRASDLKRLDQEVKERILLGLV